MISSKDGASLARSLSVLSSCLFLCQRYAFFSLLLPFQEKRFFQNDAFGPDDVASGGQGGEVQLDLVFQGEVQDFEAEHVVDGGLGVGREFALQVDGFISGIGVDGEGGLRCFRGACFEDEFIAVVVEVVVGVGVHGVPEVVFFAQGGPDDFAFVHVGLDAVNDGGDAVGEVWDGGDVAEVDEHVEGVEIVGSRRLFVDVVGYMPGRSSSPDDVGLPGKVGEGEALFGRGVLCPVFGDVDATYSLIGIADAAEDVPVELYAAGIQEVGQIGIVVGIELRVKVVVAIYFDVRRVGSPLQEVVGAVGGVVEIQSAEDEVGIHLHVVFGLPGVDGIAELSDQGGYAVVICGGVGIIEGVGNLVVGNDAEIEGRLSENRQAEEGERESE